MYGLVNRALEEMVCTHHGAAQWQAIKKRAEVEVEIFIRMQAYPDDVTYRLVGAASEILGQEPASLLRQFGRHWVLFTGREGYGDLLASAGDSLQSVLENLDDLHVRVGLMYPRLTPPSFRCEALDPATLILHYHSQRAGLAPMVIGLLEGLGERFGQTLRIRQIAEKSTTGTHDSFEIHIQ